MTDPYVPLPSTAHLRPGQLSNSQFLAQRGVLLDTIDDLRDDLVEASLLLLDSAPHKDMEWDVRCGGFLRKYGQAFVAKYGDSDD